MYKFTLYTIHIPRPKRNNSEDSVVSFVYTHAPLICSAKFNKDPLGGVGMGGGLRFVLKGPSDTATVWDPKTVAVMRR